MKRTLGLICAVGLVSVVAGCTGAQGPEGKQGPPGTGTPSVSAVTPASAFLARSVDLTIAGSGTTWSDKTTVAFTDPKVMVNKVTVASETGLLVNVTVGADAAVGANDVTVTDGTASEVYKSAFEIVAPLAVTADPAAGVPQGGLANLHVQMLDVTTPFDPNTTTFTLSSLDLLASQPLPSDYAFDLTIEADVLAKTGAFDLDVTSGGVDSPAKQSFKIAARAPVTLTSTAVASGMINTALDTALYQFAPASTAQRFVQFSVGSMNGGVLGTVIPKSGKYADAISQGFGARYGQGTTSTDPFYVVVADYDDPFNGPGPTPADLELTAFESPCTALAETVETAAANNDTAATAQAVTTLPALVNGTLGYGAVDPTTDVDVYGITVSGAPKIIHVATGGDPVDDTVLQILDGTMTAVATSDDLDYQEDLTFTAPADGTYYVSVTSSTAGFFSPSDNTYQLFIEVK